MRVRYGKPIKVKSLLGQSAFYSLSSASDKLVSHNASSKTIQEFFDAIVPNHKLFLCYNVQGDVQSNLMRIIIVRHNGSSVMASGTVSRTDNYYYQKVTAGTGVTTNQPNADMWLQKNSSYTFAAGTTFNCFVIDLTAVFGDGNEPTAEQFYNRYNKYFPLITTGEEITIDDKAGQISISRLPSEYQEVEYIESTGTQWIDLNYNPDYSNFSFELVAQMTTQMSANAYLLSGLFVYQSGGTIYFGGKYGTYSSANKYNIKAIFNHISNGTLFLNNEQVYINANNFSNYDNLIIFNSTSLHRPACAKVWLLKLYQGSSLIGNFVPCYRKSDNVIGLYDLVGKQFYTNQGTGEFLKGNNVNNTISCKVAGGSSDIYYGYNQILNKNTFTSNGITWTLNDDLTFTLSGTTTSTYSSFGLDGILKKNHKYLNILQILENPNNISMGSGFFNMGQKNPKISSGFSGAISLYPYDSSYDSMGIDQYGGVGVDLTGIKIRFQIIDLTWWYGENKEPSTYNEFKEKFTKDYYGFCKTPIKLTRYQIEALPSYEYNQLFVPTTSTANWISNSTSLVFNSDGSVTMTSTANLAYAGIQMVSSKSSSYYNTHKYLFACDCYADTKSGNGAGFGLNLYSSGTGYVIQENQAIPEKTWYRDEKIFTFTKDSSGTIYPWLFMNQRGDRTVGDKLTVKNVMLIDLTDWYGAGSEPTTVAEFKATFPNLYYSYSKKRLLNKYMINKLIN